MWCVTHGPGGKIDSLCHLTWILYTGFFQPRKCIRRRIVTCDLTSSFSLIYRQELLPNEIVKIGWLGLIWHFKFFTPVKSLFRWFFCKTTYSDNLLIHPIICIPAHGNYCIDWWLVILPWDAETDLSVHRDGHKIFRTMYQIKYTGLFWRCSAKENCPAGFSISSSWFHATLITLCALIL